MNTIPLCRPNYDWEPNYFQTTGVTCSLHRCNTQRSRITILAELPDEGSEVGHGLFFRSKEQRFESNWIEVEFDDNITIPNHHVFNVYYRNELVSEYIVQAGPGNIEILRNMINDDDEFIECPEFEFDVYDTEREVEDDDQFGLFYFPRQFLINADGPPPNPELEIIRTGPSRTMACVEYYEEIHGNLVLTPTPDRIRQYDGVQWIYYTNFVQGDCPADIVP